MRFGASKLGKERGNQEDFPISQDVQNENALVQQYIKKMRRRRKKASPTGREQVNKEKHSQVWTVRSRHPTRLEAPVLPVTCCTPLPAALPSLLPSLLFSPFCSTLYPLSNFDSPHIFMNSLSISAILSVPYVPAPL